MNLFYTIMRALLWLPAKIIFPVKVFNKKALPKERKMIVISNHLSWKDGILIAVNIPKYRHFLGKKELGKNPIIRFLAFLLGAILIDREKADMPAMRKGLKALKKNHGMMIFPEGTRNKVDDSIQEIKNGVVMFAAKSGAQIVPIMIDHESKAFKKNYLYVGEPFRLDESSSKLLTSAAMTSGAEKVVDRMKETQLELKKCVAEYLAKKNKKSKKQKIEADSTQIQAESNEAKGSQTDNESNNG